jgi:hypothetical protein
VARFSIERSDRAYDPTYGKRIKFVKLDGKVVDMPLTADTVEGLVRHVAADREGNPIMAAGQMSILESRGRVEIEWLDEAKRWNKDRSGEARVAVGRASDGDILVQVYSLARPGAIKQLRKAYSTLPSSHAAICQAAGAMAGAAAEMLADQFGDKLDPSECARVGVEQCYQMLKDNPHVATGHDVYDTRDMG